MKQDHRPWDIKRFHRGVSTDMEPRVVAGSEGMITGMENMRLTDKDGGDGSAVQIGGELLLIAQQIDNPETFHCVGSIAVSGHRWSAWASTDPAQNPPFIMIDGSIMARSPQIPYTVQRKLQLHMTEDCEGGIVFDARSGSVPLHWPIGRMIQAFNDQSQQFFSGFDLAAYQVNPTRPVNRPYFTGLVDEGSGGGQYPGLVWYATRYVNLDGDRTPDGPILGPVHIPWNHRYGWTSSVRPFPHSDTIGANVLQSADRTRWGVRMKVRINNIANYDSIEVVRLRIPANALPDTPPIVEVATRIAITPGERSVRTIIDKGDTVEGIATDESLVRNMFIRDANGVRYIDFRVTYLGVTLGARDIKGQWIEQDGTKMFPVTKSIGRNGHNDPYNACYHRRFKSGEKRSFGAVYWDAMGGESYVDSISEAFSMPSRRDRKSGASLSNSDFPCYAANVDHEVSPTFEAFDLDIAIGKSQTKQIINCMLQGARAIGPPGSLFVNRAQIPGIDPGPFFAPDGGNYGATNDWIYQSSGAGGPYAKTNGTKPLNPRRPDDYRWGLDYQVNTRVGVSQSGGTRPYNPKVFAPRQHALGAALHGLQSIPEGQIGMSVVMSRQSNNVVMQGIAKWKLVDGSQPGNDNNPNTTPASKQQWQLHVCFPEQNARAINPQTWQRILAADSRYKIRCESPVGMTTEQFGSAMTAYAGNVEGPAWSNLADLLSMARVLWDTGQCNPGQGSGGYSPSAPLPGNPDHFVGFDTWRGAPRPDSPWHQSGFNGNRKLEYTAAQQVDHEGSVDAGEGDMSVIFTMAQQVYGTAQCPSTDFDSPQAKAFHEPLYVVSLIDERAEVDDRDGYVSCNSYIPFVSQIGVGSGQLLQQFELVDERYDDVWSTQDGQERFIHVTYPDGVVRQWLFVGSFWPQYSTILNEIQNNGSWTTPGGAVIYGLYDVVLSQFEEGGLEASVSIIGPSAPPAGSIFEVRYNNAVPIKFFGDSFQVPAMGTFCDYLAAANPAEANSGQVGMTWSPQLGGSPQTGEGPTYPLHSVLWFTGNKLITGALPIPFPNYIYNDHYMVPFGHGFGMDDPPNPRSAVNQHQGGPILSVRQWKVMFDCEVSMQYFMGMWSSAEKNTPYPISNYTQRPYNFDPNASAIANGVHENYMDWYLYGVGDWRRGGFCSKVRVLTGYNERLGPRYFRVSEFGKREQVKQCAALVYSERATPVMVDMPGLKTFPMDNIEYIEATRGHGQRLFSAAAGDGGGGTGYNLYAIMERGIRMILIGHNIARSDDGEAFTMFRVDKFIGGQLWIEGATGMPGDSWQTAAEGKVFLGGPIKKEALIWSDKNSLHVLSGNACVDVAQGVFRKDIVDLMQPDQITSTMRGYHAVFDETNNEYLVGASDSRSSGILSVAFRKSGIAYQQRFRYAFDDLLFAYGKLYGHRRAGVWQLDEGAFIGEAPVRSFIVVPTSPYPGERIQILRVKTDSTRKPKRMEFLDENGALVAWTDAQRAQFLGFPGWTYMKRVTAGFECLAPSTNESIDPLKPKTQGAVLFYKAIFEAEEGHRVKVALTGAQSKPLK